MLTESSSGGRGRAWAVRVGQRAHGTQSKGPRRHLFSVTLAIFTLNLHSFDSNLHTLYKLKKL